MEQRKYGFRVCRCIWCNSTPATHRDGLTVPNEGAFGVAWFCDGCWEVWEAWILTQRSKTKRARRVIYEAR